MFQLNIQKLLEIYVFFFGGGKKVFNFWAKIGKREKKIVLRENLLYVFTVW